jgi:hypothetical protein
VIHRSCSTQQFQDEKIHDWLTQLQLDSSIDRLEIDAHLNFLEGYNKQILKIEPEMATRALTDRIFLEIKKMYF